MRKSDAKNGLVFGCAAAIAFAAGTVLFAAVAVGFASLAIGRGLDRLNATGREECFSMGVEDDAAPKVLQLEVVGDIGGGAPNGGGLMEMLGLGGAAPAKDPAAEVRKLVREAIGDSSVRGIYLYLDSPGGSLAASDALRHDLESFRASRTNRFVFVQMGEQCCSGGLLAAMAANRIMAAPATVTGSIGVISDFGLNYAGLAEKLGVKSMVVATGTQKDAFNPVKPVDEAQIARERAIVTGQLDLFVEAIVRSRGLAPEKVRALADGRSFTAAEALELGLIDAVGYDESAYVELCELAGEQVMVVKWQDVHSPILDLLH